MSLKARLKRQLESTRQMTEKLLANFQTPADFLFQVHPSCNHAMWFVGHMASTDNFLLSLIAKEKQIELPGYQAAFGMGSTPSSDAASYPSPEAALATMRERRETLLAVLDGSNDEALAAKTPDGAPEFLPDVASVFEMANWHESLHAGQLSVTRRALGHRPVVG